MNNTKKPSPEVLREALLELEEPVLLRDILHDNDPENNWRLLELSNLIKMMSQIDSMRKLPFRVGLNAPTSKPQWDVTCPIEHLNISELLTKIEKNDFCKWYYFDYKYMNEWFSVRPEILNAVDWKNFGFEETGKDSTLWIGSKGAHTNCHQDSYGCNLIAQLHGSKQWLLFPRDSGTILKETRVPYEESTIYSRINFFCPLKEDEDFMMNSQMDGLLPKSIILKPGDVLLVPRGWWHYVESLDLTVSVNVWLPLDFDYKARIKEALVKLIMSGIGIGIPTADESCTTQTCVELVEECVKQYRELPERNSLSNNSNKRMKKTLWNSQDLIAEYPDHIQELNTWSKNELKDFLTLQRERFSQNYKNSHNASLKPKSSDNILENIVDTLCHSDNINKLTNVLLTEE